MHKPDAQARRIYAPTLPPSLPAVSAPPEGYAANPNFRPGARGGLSGAGAATLAQYTPAPMHAASVDGLDEDAVEEEEEEEDVEDLTIDRSRGPGEVVDYDDPLNDFALS